MMIIQGVSKDARYRVSMHGKAGHKADVNCIQNWILDTLDKLANSDVMKIAYHLLTIDQNEENLLEVYSYASHCIDEFS